MRDAIVFSGWSWEAFNVPERIALAMRQLGARVLYCENPVSLIHRTRPGLREVEPGIYSFQPYFYGTRLNAFPPLRSMQARKLAAQVFYQSESLNLREPIFFYFFLRDLLPLCMQIKKKFALVNVQMDYGQPESSEHASLSDLTLAIPRSAYDKLRAEFGDKVRLIPQVVDFRAFSAVRNGDRAEAPALRDIPRPRLGYLGPAYNRLNLPALEELLCMRPDWHFISVGGSPVLALPNAHAIPWQSQETLPQCVASLDVGFLPYSCKDIRDLHCVPLKLFECFALGLPVVSPRLVNLQEFTDVLYFAETPAEMAAAVEQALGEPRDSLKRKRRIDIAREHSVESLAQLLQRTLPLENGMRAQPECR